MSRSLPKWLDPPPNRPPHVVASELRLRASDVEREDPKLAAKLRFRAFELDAKAERLARYAS